LIQITLRNLASAYLIDFQVRKLYLSLLNSDLDQQVQHFEKFGGREIPNHTIEVKRLRRLRLERLQPIVPWSLLVELSFQSANLLSQE
jgi:hypothetical protein